MVVTSTPDTQSAPPISPQAITRIGRAVSFRMGVTDENAPSEGETSPRPTIRDPTGPKTTLRAHEEQYFRLQNQSQTYLPLFPDDLAGSGTTEFHTANDQTLRSAVHGETPHLHRPSRTSQTTWLSSITSPPPMRMFLSLTGTTPSGTLSGKHSRSLSTRITRYRLSLSLTS